MERKACVQPFSFFIISLLCIKENLVTIFNFLFFCFLLENFLSFFNYLKVHYVKDNPNYLNSCFEFIKYIKRN